MDAVDTALAAFKDEQCELVRYRQFPIPRELSDKLKKIGPRTPVSEVLQCDSAMGDLFADAALSILAEAGIEPGQVAAIGSHGQTLLHQPTGKYSNTLQIGDPNRITWRTGISVVADFRRMDMAAGGHGAPFLPAFHNWRLREPGIERVVVNIGGIANVTLLPAAADQPVTGFDTGPGNTLMDQWASARIGEPMDRDGRWAAGGSVSSALLEELLKETYFSAPAPKSTGRDYFNLEWLEDRLARTHPRPADVDVQATLLELSCATIASAIRAHAPRAESVILCGGGVHNPQLTNRLATLLTGIPVESSAAHGVDPDAVEALGFAWLARQRMSEQAGNLPSVTGATAEVVSGAVYRRDPRR